MATFAEQITDIAIPDVAPMDAVEAPRIWWYNGVRAAKTPGSFYTKSSEFPAGLGEPWQVDNRFEDEQGWSATTLKLAPLAVRAQPFRDPKGADGKRDRNQPRQWATRWEPGMQIYTEVLCLIDGYTGPVIFCSDGLFGKAVDGKGGILKTYQAGLLAEASRIAGRQMPLWSFWLPITSKRNGDKIAYEDTGYGSFVVLPVLALPENPIDALFVGPDVLAKGAEILNTSFNKWSKTIPPHRLPGNTVEATYTVTEPAALPAPRNVPQVITPDDY